MRVEGACPAFILANVELRSAVSGHSEIDVAGELLGLIFKVSYADAENVMVK